jgi:tetratricopeptide (TPR) repeat protein
MFAEDGVNLDEAVQLIKKALEFEPDNGAYIDSLGWAYFKKGELAPALRELEKAARSEPDDPEVADHLKKVKEAIKKKK